MVIKSLRFDDIWNFRYFFFNSDHRMAEVVVNTDACAPVPGVKYPIIVEYCGNCSMPFEVKFLRLKECIE